MGRTPRGCRPGSGLNIAAALMHLVCACGTAPTCPPPPYMPPPHCVLTLPSHAGGGSDCEWCHACWGACAVPAALCSLLCLLGAALTALFACFRLSVTSRKPAQLEALGPGHRPHQLLLPLLEPDRRQGPLLCEPSCLCVCMYVCMSLSVYVRTGVHVAEHVTYTSPVGCMPPWLGIQGDGKAAARCAHAVVADVPNLCSG